MNRWYQPSKYGLFIAALLTLPVFFAKRPDPTICFSTEKMTILACTLQSSGSSKSLHDTSIMDRTRRTSPIFRGKDRLLQGGLQL